MTTVAHSQHALVRTHAQTDKFAACLQYLLQTLNVTFSLQVYGHSCVHEIGL